MKDLKLPQIDLLDLRSLFYSFWHCFFFAVDEPTKQAGSPPLRAQVMAPPDERIVQAFTGASAEHLNTLPNEDISHALENCVIPKKIKGFWLDALPKERVVTILNNLSERVNRAVPDQKVQRIRARIPGKIPFF